MADKKQDKAKDAAAAVDPEVQDADPTTGDRVAEGESAGESTSESTGETSSDQAADPADAGYRPDSR
mgnify:CR=1 FL=1